MTLMEEETVEALKQERLRRLKPNTKEWYVELGEESITDWTLDPKMIERAVEDMTGHTFMPCPKCGSHDRRAEDRKERFNRIYGGMRGLFPSETNKTIYNYAQNYTMGTGIHTLVCNKCDFVHKPERVKMTEEQKDAERKRRYRLRAIANEMIPNA